MEVQQLRIWVTDQKGWGFAPRYCWAATDELLSKAYDPLCSRGAVLLLTFCFVSKFLNNAVTYEEKYL